jgi:flavorubredoxin
MPVTNKESGTNVNEIADGIYRICTPAPPDRIPGGFTYSSYLIVDDEPLLFHTGLRRIFPLVREAVASVIPVERLRYISFSHVESDESGSLNQWLAAAPNAVPLCGRLAARIQVEDMADRPPRAMAEGETVSLGVHSVKWLDAPHVPHAWECGFMFEAHTGTLLCSDLFTQPGGNPPPITESDILGPSESLRSHLDYFAHGTNTRSVLEKLAGTNPRTLACMHGSAWRGDGAALIRALADVLSR